MEIAQLIITTCIQHNYGCIREFFREHEIYRVPLADSTPDNPRFRWILVRSRGTRLRHSSDLQKNFYYQVTYVGGLFLTYCVLTQKCTPFETRRISA